MDRNWVATSIGIRWRNESESGGGLRRNTQLNPAEQIWNILRRDYFANRVFDALDAATTQAESGLAEMAANKSAIRQLTNWPWISAILKT
jgi:hypothetical protein